MTAHYLSGEVSVRLGDLGGLTTDPAVAARVSELRIRLERCAPDRLVAHVSGVIDAIDDACWKALAKDDIVEFVRLAGAAHCFAEFARAARLMPDDEVTRPA